MLLEMRGLTKRFGSFTANDSIELTIEPGEIHCLLGENGAGKSTLMNMLYGLLEPTEGGIFIDGEPADFESPADAIAAGIGMVHQHFMLVPVFTVAENVMLGREQLRSLGGSTARPPPSTSGALLDLQARVKPEPLVESLPVGVQQRVEILKALANDAKVLILDEPTAVLTPQETDELMGIMRSLKERGTSIIFITHKLREVKAIGDKITVIRRGKVVGTAPPTTSRGRARRDDGRPRGQARRRQGARQARCDVLAVRDVTVDRQPRRDGRRRRVVHGAGGRGAGHRRGAGQRPDRADQDPDGADRADGGHGLPGRRGHLRLRPQAQPRGRHRLHPRGSGRTTATSGPSASTRTSSSTCSETGVLLARRAPPRQDRRERARPGQRVRHPHREHRVQPELALGRQPAEGRRRARAVPPAAGADRLPAHPRCRRRARSSSSTSGSSRSATEGTAVIIVSTELDEVFGLADRIAVMYDGRIVDTVSPDIKREEIGLLMAGGGDCTCAEVETRARGDATRRSRRTPLRGPVAPDGEDDAALDPGGPVLRSRPDRGATRG